jgi:hypothetical protein
MDEKLYEMVSSLYQKGDAVTMFRAMLSAAGAASGGDMGRFASGGMAQVALGGFLECLELGVIRKRLSWLEENAASVERTGNPLADGFRIFYETYLGLSIPRDGEIVASDDRRLVSRWWNRCPTLDACLETGLDTREVCRKAYEKPVQLFLSRLDPRLRFRRNYDALRPRAPYCEEIIEIVGDEDFDRVSASGSLIAGSPVQGGSPK